LRMHTADRVSLFLGKEGTMEPCVLCANDGANLWVREWDDRPGREWPICQTCYEEYGASLELVGGLPEDF